MRSGLAPNTKTKLMKRTALITLPLFAICFVYLLGHYMTANARIEELRFELSTIIGKKNSQGICICDCPKCDNNNKEKVKKYINEGGDKKENHIPLIGDDLIQGGGKGSDADHPNEEGWVYGLERVASRTSKTSYDPKNDAALVIPDAQGLRKYAQSPVPKGSWQIQLGPNKFITMDDVAFGYDVWYEQNQVFQYTSWMGVFCQQDPSDAFAIQDMLWRVKPDLIIEIGTNTGGGAIFYATFMKAYNPQGKIVTLDVKDISNWNRRNPERCVGCVLATEHPWWGDGMIHFIKGRVTDKAIQTRIEEEFVSKAKTVLVIEDASHQYPATLDNMEASYRWVTKGSYLLVQDTKMDRFVQQLDIKYGNLKFGPMRSVDEFIDKHSDQFVIDRRFEYLLYSQHHRGWLRRR